MTRRIAVLLVAAAFAGGCATPPPPPKPPLERIVLLPDKDGRVGAIDVTTGSGTTPLDKAYATADVRGQTTVAETLSQEAVVKRYGRVIDDLPARPRHYMLNFEFATDRLTAASRAILPRIQAELKQFPAAEVLIIGHTDNVGDTAYNDKLSFDRANAIREALIAAGVPRESTSAIGRGAREPAVASRPGRPEPRNRRVEIKLR